MDKSKDIINFIINKCLLSVIIFIGVTAGVIWLGYTIIYPGITNILDIREQNIANQAKIEDLKKKVEAEKLKQKQEKTKVRKVPVTLFRSLTPGMPLESSSIDFVTAVIKKLEKTNNSIMDISYKIDETAKNNLPANVSVVKLVMTLNGSYTSFQDFIFELYDDNYLATIKQLKITPLKENKSMLEINLEIWLYVAK